MDKLKKALSGDDADEEQGIVTQVNFFFTFTCRYSRHFLRGRGFFSNIIFTGLTDTKSELMPLSV